MLRSHVFTDAFKLNMIEPGGCFDRAFQVPSVHEDTGDAGNILSRPV